MYSLPDRHQADATRSWTKHHQGPGHTGGSGQAGGTVPTTSRATPSAVWARRLPTRFCPPSSISGTNMSAHVKEKRCPAGVLQGAAHLQHRSGQVQGLLRMLLEICPADAISGVIKSALQDRYIQVHQVRQPAWKNVSLALFPRVKEAQAKDGYCEIKDQWH